MRTAIPLAALLGACAKPPPEAPKELGELGAFLFANFEAEDTAEMGAGWVNLRDYLLGVDMTADAKDIAVTMPILQGDDLGGLSIPDGADANKQVNVALPGMSTFGLDDQRPLHTEPNQICIESSTTVWAGRTLLTDGDCWLAGSCDRLETLTEVRKENLLAQVWYDQFKNYRTFDVETEDGETFQVVAGRSWIEEVFPGDGGATSWDQLFALDVTMPDPNGSGTLRWYAMWSSITVAAIGDDVYANLVRDGIAEAYIYADEFLAGDIQTCKNDRDAEKPPRE